MSDAIENGGQAFPATIVGLPDGGVAFADAQGMTLRDYFAAKAMAAVIARHGVYDESAQDRSEAYFDKEAAEISYVYADAMLKEREA